MLRTLLVVGLLVHDSGKTWFTVSLARYAISRGLRVALYKPVAGHSAWHQYETVSRSKSLGVLVGHDVYLYREYVDRDLDIALSNPIDILMAPISMDRYIRDRAFEEYARDLEDQLKQAILVRISDCLKRTHKHFLIEENLKYVASSLKSDIEELAKVLRAESLRLEDLLSYLKSSDIDKKLDECFEVLSRDKDLVIVESFNDAITPYVSALKRTDLVVAIAPGYAIVYRDINAIARALRVEVYSRGEEGYRSIYVLSHVEPFKVLELRPRESIELVDHDVAEELIDLLMSATAIDSLAIKIQ